VTLNEQGSKSPLLFTPKMELTTNHAIIVNNLKPGTTYTFTLTSKDAGGIESHFDSGQSFTTIAALPIGPEIGKMAPDFTLITTEGKNLTLSSYRGKLVLLNFWQRGCPACVREMPMMQTFFSKLTSDQIVIIGVNVREDEATVKAFKERWNLTFPILLDPTGQISRSYVIDDIPATFFINGQGVIKEIKIGPFDSAEDIGSVINSLGSKPATTK
jgi:peroxiredoxin